MKSALGTSMLAEYKGKTQPFIMLLGRRLNCDSPSTPSSSQFLTLHKQSLLLKNTLPTYTNSSASLLCVESNAVVTESCGAASAQLLDKDPSPAD